MPAFQTTFDIDPPIGYAGMVKNTEKHNIISRTNPAGATPFGVVAVRGALDNAAVVPGQSGATAFPLGITVYNNYGAAGTDGYAQYDTVAIMTKGVIAVVTASAATPGAPVYFADDGSITATATDNTALPNAVFDSTAAADGLVWVRLS